MNIFQYNVLIQNNDDDINPTQECAIEADAFSQKAIPLIIKDDLDKFIDLVSDPEFNWDGNFPHARERMYLSNYLYQPFFDELTGPTALCFAAFFNAEKIVDFILGLPDVDKADAFHFACAGGSFNVMRTLFDQSTCDLVNKDHLRPLNIASYFGNVDVVKYLWAHGCPIISPEDMYSSVNKAAFNGNIDVLDFFKEVDPNLLKKMKEYKHPIISAAIGGQPKCVSYFLEQGDLNRTTLSSALAEGCKKGSLACVKILADAYINYKPPTNSDSCKKKSPKKKARKKKEEEEFMPTRTKGKKRKSKKDNDSEEENIDEEEEEYDEDQKLEAKLEKEKCLPISAYIAAIKKSHVDILRYLLSVSTPDSIDKLFVCSIEQIKFQELLDRIVTNDRFPFMLQHRKPPNIEAIKNKWIQKSLPAIKMSKFLFQNYILCKSINSLFDIFGQDISINNAIYFLDQINFKIIKDDELTDNQIEFFRCAILYADSITIPLINKIMNNNDIDFFESGSFEKLAESITDDKNQNSQRKKKYDENNDEYLEKQRLMDTFYDYLSILSQRKNTFQTISACFLIEKKFPFYIIVDHKMKNISSFQFLLFPFYEACLRKGMYDYAYKFLCLQPPYQINQGFSLLFKEANKLFNKDATEEINQKDQQDPSFENEYKVSIPISEFNNEGSKEGENENVAKSTFNIFKYQCQNEDEEKNYQDIMTMIKLVIKMFSAQSRTATILCNNGLNKEWIIEHMKNEDENEILKDNESVNNTRSFYGYSRYKQINKKDYENNSINPLFNLAKTNNNNNPVYFFGYQQRDEILSALKCYINNGIDVSPGTEYAGILWKYLIDTRNGLFIKILINNGNPDKEVRLLDNSICLFDYAIEVKAVNVIYLFLKYNFYAEDSLAKDPNALIAMLNNEKVKKNKKQESSELRKVNLKIIVLIYTYLKDNYDQKLKSKLISELKIRMKPNIKNQFYF